MANVPFKKPATPDGYFKATGAGTDGDPYVIEQAVTVTGGATAAHQTTAHTKLDALATALANLLSELQDKADLDETQPVNLTTLPDTASGDLAALVAALAATLSVDVASVAAPSTIYNGQTTVTTAGTAVALTTTQAISSGVTVRALAGNAGLIYVGASDVDSTNGFELSAGDAIFIDTDDLASVFVDSAEDGEGVSFIAS